MMNGNNEEVQEGTEGKSPFKFVQGWVFHKPLLVFFIFSMLAFGFGCGTRYYSCALEAQVGPVGRPSKITAIAE